MTVSSGLGDRGRVFVWLATCLQPESWLSAHILTLMPIFRSSGSESGRVGGPLRLASAMGAVRDSRGHGAGAVISSQQHSRNSYLPATNRANGIDFAST